MPCQRGCRDTQLCGVCVVVGMTARRSVTWRTATFRPILARPDLQARTPYFVASCTVFIMERQRWGDFDKESASLSPAQVGHLQRLDSPRFNIYPRIVA